MRDLWNINKMEEALENSMHVYPDLFIYDIIVFAGNLSIELPSA
jgi:hypothetical protein